jgi:hypothetical protein
MRLIGLGTYGIHYLAAALLAVRVLEPERGLGLGEGADVAGAVLVTSSLMLGIYAIVGVTDHGWGSLQTGGFGILAMALLAGFIARQATAQNPLLPLRVFRSRNLSGANAVQALLIAGMLGMLFIGALYMQRILGYQPLEIGLAYLLAALGIATLSLRVTPRLIIRFGERATLLTGLTIMTAGLVNTTGQLGGAPGIAVLATLATSRTDQLLAAGANSVEALLSGFHLAFITSVALVAAGIVLGAVVLRRQSAVSVDG